MNLQRDERGAAMLEYTLVSCIVVLAALAPYVKWTVKGTDTTASLIDGYTRQTRAAVQFISLPCP
jgi:Flp pilus assembly pilin Flp